MRGQLTQDFHSGGRAGELTLAYSKLRFFKLKTIMKLITHCGIEKNLGLCIYAASRVITADSYIRDFRKHISLPLTFILFDGVQ